MIIRNITLSRNYCFLKKLSNVQNSNIIPTKQLTHCYPFFLTNNNDYYSYSGLVLPRNNYKLQLFSSRIDVRSKNPDDFKGLSSSSMCEKDNKSNKNAPVETKKEKLKKALKQYGSVVIVFHIGISLISLGFFYLLVSSGLDMAKFIEAVGLDRWLSKNEIAANAGTFAMAYMIHKLFAPVRISITLASIPFVVRYLRRVGMLKK